MPLSSSAMPRLYHSTACSLGPETHTILIKQSILTKREPLQPEQRLHVRLSTVPQYCIHIMYTINTFHMDHMIDPPGHCYVETQSKSIHSNQWVLWSIHTDPIGTYYIQRFVQRSFRKFGSNLHYRTEAAINRLHRKVFTNIYWPNMFAWPRTPGAVCCWSTFLVQAGLALLSWSRLV